MLTQDLLKELTTYDPETGIMKWLPRDAKHFKTINQFKNWNGRYPGETVGYRVHGYLRARIIEKKSYGLNRLIHLYMTGILPEVVDHANGMPLDNRWVNLTNADLLVNSHNQKIRKDNRTGVGGVSWRNDAKKYRSSIKVNGKVIALGHYDNLFDAACARFSANNKYEFSKRHGRDQLRS